MLEERDPQGWVLKALREAGNSLLTELLGVDGETSSRRPADGGWCLREVAAHLRDAEELALAQLRAIGQDARRPLPAWDIDLLPLERDYRSAAMEGVLAELRRLRRETTLLLWGLTAADWQRTGDHPYRGRVTLGEIARELAQHDLEHLWQVRRLKLELGEAAPVSDDWP